MWTKMKIKRKRLQTFYYSWTRVGQLILAFETRGVSPSKALYLFLNTILIGYILFTFWTWSLPYLVVYMTPSRCQFEISDILICYVCVILQRFIYIVYFKYFLRKSFVIFNLTYNFFFYVDKNILSFIYSTRRSKSL